MEHHVPYARSNVGSSQIEALVKWLGVNRLLEMTRQLPSETEFSILVDFLVEFAGGLELAERRMGETLAGSAAISYMAYVETVKKIKHRLMELYRKER